MRTPRFYRTVWASVVEAFYGDVDKAHAWMLADCKELGGIPFELCRDSLQRDRVLNQIEIMERSKMRRHPITAWHRSPAVYPCENGELMFRNTTVLITRLFAILRDGGTLDDFLKISPGVTQFQVDWLMDQIYLDLCEF
jgi:hypothetical protein